LTGIFLSHHLLSGHSRIIHLDLLIPVARSHASGTPGASAKLTCSRQSLCVVNDQPIGNPKRKV
jgi:hypothetical protein